MKYDIKDIKLAEKGRSHGPRASEHDCGTFAGNPSNALEIDFSTST